MERRERVMGQRLREAAREESGTGIGRVRHEKMDSDKEEKIGTENRGERLDGGRRHEFQSGRKEETKGEALF
jgi:hypothetical protein